jgi:glycosyltransferase involved in cell wall biosynthesis
VVLTRIRVLRIIARLNMGGPAHQASLLSGRRFDPERYETLLVHGSLASGEKSMAYLAEGEGAKTLFVPELAPPLNPIRDARALTRLARIARRFQPQIVHTHTAKAGFVGRLAALMASRPRPAIVHTYHGHVLEAYFGPGKTALYRRLEFLAARFSDLLVGVSQATVDDLVRLGVAPRDRFRVVPLGLDLEPFARIGPGTESDLRAELSIRPEQVVFSYVGRLVPIKRLDLLLRAFARMDADTESSQLLVVGDGETRPALERLSRELRIDSRVHFLGYRGNIESVAAAADAAVLSSENEGTPVSLIEAAAAGRPAVATAVGGVPEVVTRETGILVSPGDDEAMASAMSRIARDRQLRQAMGEKARERALLRHSAERLISDMKSLYEELLAPTARAQD